MPTKKRTAPKKNKANTKGTPGPYLCIHVEKTAGTSFRSTVLDQFETVFDYGAISDSTSKRIREFWQGNPKDLQYFRDKGIEAIYGHFPPEKYLALEPDLPVITWIREPEDRIVSDFNFRRRPNDIPDSPIDFEIQSGKIGFSDYLQRPNFQNVISRYLSKVPPKNFVFIGNTKSYDADLTHFGNLFNCHPLSRRPKNKNNSEKYLPSSKERALLTKVNSADYELYEQLSVISEDLKKKSRPLVASNQLIDHGKSMWDDCVLKIDGKNVKVPRFLRNSWRLRGQHPSNLDDNQPTNESDFQRWYLYHGINEFDPGDAVYGEIVTRFTEALFPQLTQASYEWLVRLKEYPQAYLAYCLRADLRKGHELGDDAGVDAFLRWWDSKALESHGPDRQGLLLFPFFNWELISWETDGMTVEIPRLLRDIWLSRPDLQKRFDPSSPTFQSDFEKWYLLLGAKEIQSTALAVPVLIKRNFPTSTTEMGSGDALSLTWFDRLKEVPKLCLIYLQRPDLRKDLEIGDEEGVINFLNWWNSEGGRQFGTPIRGQKLLYDFNWEPIFFDLIHQEIRFPRLWQNIWLSRPDLQKAFPLEQRNFASNFQRWFLTSGANEVYGLGLAIPRRWDLPE